MELLPVLRYLVVLAVFTALGAPLAAVVFERLPRKGAAFALPTALLPFAIVVFWIGQLAFGYWTLVLGLLVLLAAATVARRRGYEPDWPAVARTYGVFVLGFLVLVLFRASSPGITPGGGEQFLHFGMLNALERATVLPPEDLWYAGEPLKYYYGTQLQVASLAMLSGTEMRYGFNLGIAAFYGVLFVTAYGLASAVAARQDYPERLCGALGVLFVAIGGGTTTAVRLTTPHLPAFLERPLEVAAFGFVANRFNGGDLATTVAELSSIEEWSWWYTRYVVPGTIQETPMYSFIKGDLHGHALSTGYVLFAGAVAYAYYVTPAEERGRRAAIVFGGLGAIAGVFGFMNTWALPTAGGLAFLAVGAATAHPATMLPGTFADRLRPTVDGTTNDGEGEGGADDTTVTGAGRVAAEIWRLVLATVAAAIVVAIGVAVASPFLVFGEIPSNNGIGVLPPRSPLGSFLVIYSGLIAVFATYVLARGWPTLEEVDERVVAAGAIALAIACIALVAWLDFAVLALTGPLILAAWVLVRTDRGGYALVLLVAGAGLLLSLELVHAKLPEIRNPRWNTSLKVAVQAWTLGAAGAGVATGALLATGWDRVTTALDAAGRRPDDGPSTAPRTRVALGWGLALVVVVAAIATSLAFPAMAVGQEIGSQVQDGDWNPTLDGHAYLEGWHPQEADAIAWLDDREGKPTIVEAPGRPYGWTSPAAVFTGLPSVIGWDHQEEYRSPEAYDRRVNAVDSIYSGSWERAAANLSRYDVAYVYVGPNERDRYRATLRSFDHDAFTVAFENGAVTIYAVDQSELPGNETTN